MRNSLLLSAVLAAALAACKPPKYVEPEPEPIDPPVPPVERILRLPVNYSFKSQDGRKEFRLRQYSDEEIVDDIVTVLDGAPYERYATPAEFDFAMGEFMARWVNAQQDDQIAFHRRLWETEAAKRAAGLDDMIERKKERVAKLENDWWELKCDIVTRGGAKIVVTDSDKEAPDSLPFRNTELARLEDLLVAEKARLQILEQQKHLRDGGSSLETLKSDIDKLKGLLDK